MRMEPMGLSWHLLNITPTFLAERIVSIWLKSTTDNNPKSGLDLNTMSYSFPVTSCSLRMSCIPLYHMIYQHNFKSQKKKIKRDHKLL